MHPFDLIKASALSPELIDQECLQKTYCGRLAINNVVF